LSAKYHPLFDAAHLGHSASQRCDALDYANKMAAEFQSTSIQIGILICGSGQAMTMTANRYPDSNVLVLSVDFTPPAEALKILEIFLCTKFLGVDMPSAAMR
jgi:ribose 5-phosphate isomerase B